MSSKPVPKNQYIFRGTVPHIQFLWSQNIVVLLIFRMHNKGILEFKTRGEIEISHPWNTDHLMILSSFFTRGYTNLVSTKVISPSPVVSLVVPIIIRCLSTTWWSHSKSWNTTSSIWEILVPENTHDLLRITMNNIIRITYKI